MTTAPNLPIYKYSAENSTNNHHSTESGHNSDSVKGSSDTGEQMFDSRWMRKIFAAADSASPIQIVEDLNRYIIGQGGAKKAIAIAIRNRIRRQKVSPESLQDDIIPKNILMIGDTGVGKTEIARRVAKSQKFPFIKVEATKFTEVGYVGRDVESIIRDLVSKTVEACRLDMREVVLERAKQEAEEVILEHLIAGDAGEATKRLCRERLRNGKCEEEEITIEVTENKNMMPMEMPGGGSVQIGFAGDFLNKILGGNKKTKTTKIKYARELIIEEQVAKLLNEEMIIKEAIYSVANRGIVFIDEIDKIVSNTEFRRGGGEVSREGVQRDLLSLIEGTTVNTKYGTVKTDHILFIASGAFKSAKPSDLMAELQGRLPVRVELQALTKEDFVRILTETENSLPKQYIAMMATENIEVEFKQDAIDLIAEISFEVNLSVENIGARRLHTILEKVMEEIGFESSRLKEEAARYVIDADYVRKMLEGAYKPSDLSKFIL